jgi:hypothetical protein
MESQGFMMAMRYDKYTIVADQTSAYNSSRINSTGWCSSFVIMIPRIAEVVVESTFFTLRYFKNISFKIVGHT